MIELLPLNIATTAILIGVCVVFGAVILAAFTTRKPSNNGLVYDWEIRQNRRMTRNGRQ